MFAGEFFGLVCQHGCVYEPALYCNPEENRSYKQNTTSSVQGEGGGEGSRKDLSRCSGWKARLQARSESIPGCHHISSLKKKSPVFSGRREPLTQACAMYRPGTDVNSSVGYRNPCSLIESLIRKHGSSPTCSTPPWRSWKNLLQLRHCFVVSCFSFRTLKSCIFYPTTKESGCLRP